MYRGVVADDGVDAVVNVRKWCDGQVRCRKQEWEARSASEDGVIQHRTIERDMSCQFYPLLCTTLFVEVGVLARPIDRHCVR